jgi:hypothetical protein
MSLSDHFRINPRGIFYPEEVNNVLQNVDTCLPNYKGHHIQEVSNLQKATAFFLFNGMLMYHLTLKCSQYLGVKCL